MTVPGGTLSLIFQSLLNFFTIRGQLLQQVHRFLKSGIAGAFPETNEAISNAVLYFRQPAAINILTT
jgi:hypothetical protein